MNKFLKSNPKQPSKIPIRQKQDDKELYTD